nr:uncharacterized protein LOC105480951 [Macaca nemestrina]
MCTKAAERLVWCRRLYPRVVKVSPQGRRFSFCEIRNSAPHFQAPAPLRASTLSDAQAQACTFLAQTLAKSSRNCLGDRCLPSGHPAASGRSLPRSFADPRCVALSKWLRTGMQGAFGKSQGTVARVRIAQVIMSICTKLQNKEHMIEALRRAKFKFPGHQKIHISKKWGFIKFNADAFEDMVAEKQLIPDGCGVKYIPSCGPLNKWRALHS